MAGKKEKYKIIRKLDAGGMAEVFQGVAEGIEGFKKKVAIKRVLPHLVENKKFLSMFLDEARLSLRLTHANIVQVFDIGKAGGTFFIVMEFVDGTNLKNLVEILREKKTKLPIELAIHIIIEVCKGLNYAHEFEDADGKKLNIVHRDVSPPNVLLSKEGEVKLVDFGLAKATSQLEETDPGVVKGKFAYLAPEAAWGKSVDKRADIFACGIILYELLTGKRLFLGETDVKTVELVRRSVVPEMAQFNPDIKPKLEAIVRKSLATKQEDRYQSCDQLADELAGYLFEQQLKVTGFDLRRVVSEIISTPAKSNVVSTSIIDKLIQEEMSGFASLDSSSSVFEPSETVKKGSNVGGLPLNPSGFQKEQGNFEDPRGWEGEMKVGGRNSPLPEKPHSEWRESGLYENDANGTVKPVIPQNNRRKTDRLDDLANLLEGEAGNPIESSYPLSTDEPDGDGKKGFFVGVMMALGIAALAASIAYLLGWVP